MSGTTDDDRLSAPLLTPNQAIVLLSRARGDTLRKIGAALHVSAERVRQIERKALRALPKDMALRYAHRILMKQKRAKEREEEHETKAAATICLIEALIEMRPYVGSEV